MKECTLNTASCLVTYKSHRSLFMKAFITFGVTGWTRHNMEDQGREKKGTCTEKQHWLLN